MMMQFPPNLYSANDMAFYLTENLIGVRRLRSIGNPIKQLPEETRHVTDLKILWVEMGFSLDDIESKKSQREAMKELAAEIKLYSGLSKLLMFYELDSDFKYCDVNKQEFREVPVRFLRAYDMTKNTYIYRAEVCFRIVT